MYIPTSLKSTIPNSIDRRGSNVWCFRVFLGQDSRYHFDKQFLIIILIILPTPSPTLNPLQDLIIATPQNQSRVIPSPSNLLCDFCFNIEQEVIGGRIDTITEHEIIE